jgi:hypothetical protein
LFRCRAETFKKSLRILSPHQRFSDHGSVNACSRRSANILHRSNATAHNRGVDLFVAIPAIKAPVRVKNSGEQFVYLVFPSAAGFFIEKV